MLQGIGRVKEKKGKPQSLREALKSFQRRLDTAVKELGNAREIKRRGLPGRCGSPSWKAEKDARAENVKKGKAKVVGIEKADILFSIPTTLASPFFTFSAQASFSTFQDPCVSPEGLSS